MLASLLARQGVDVIVAARSTQGGARRPNELLLPETRRALSRLDFDEPQSHTAPCERIVIAWADPEPVVNDFVLLDCNAGLAVDRQPFHDALLKTTQLHGARVIAGSLQRLPRAAFATPARPMGVRVGDDEVRCDYLVDATGRASSSTSLIGLTRDRTDRLVALSTRVPGNRHQNALLVEATRNGWWYMPPPIGEATDLVFLTDIDLLPLGRANRRAWLSTEFGAGRLIREALGRKPRFDDVVGVNACVSSIRNPVERQRIAIGDAAISVDPLSGMGTLLGIRGAERVADCLCGKVFDADRYRQWCREIVRTEYLSRMNQYSRAASRFSESTFWLRRAPIETRMTRI